MKGFGVKLLAVLLCALPAQTAWAFEYFYTPTFNKVPNLTIVGWLPADAGLRPVAGDLQFGVFQGRAEVSLSTPSAVRAANSSGQSRPKHSGFPGSAVLNDTSIPREQSFRTVHRRQQNKDCHLKQFARWRPLPALTVCRTLG